MKRVYIIPEYDEICRLIYVEHQQYISFEDFKHQFNIHASGGLINECGLKILYIYFIARFNNTIPHSDFMLISDFWLKNQVIADSKLLDVYNKIYRNRLTTSR